MRKINFVPKRSTYGIAAAVIALSVIVGIYNSTSVNTAVVQIKKVNEHILDELNISNQDKIHLRDEILNDYDNRISDEFTINPGLKDRVGFWFDIYTQYDSHKRLIHHATYPWIIFKVVDVTPIINSNKPKARWMRNLKADKFVDQEFHRIKSALKQINKTDKVNDKDKYQLAVAEALKPLEGSLKEKSRKALENIRVQTGQKNFFHSGLETSPLYLKEIEEIFRNYKLPVELTRLPFVESSFNHRAVSKVGASGIWQFMDYTGRSFLTINDHIDERNSPLKASVAAAKLLKQNYKILKGAWPLAITAWNHGPTGMLKASKAAKSNDLATIIRTYQSRTFDFASSNFYCEFLAALYAEKYHEQIFFNLEYEKTLTLHRVKLARSVPAKELLRRSGLSRENFVLYNPDLTRALDRNARVPHGFVLMVDPSTRLTLKNLISKDKISEKGTKVSQSGVSYNSTN